MSVSHRLRRAVAISAVGLACLAGSAGAVSASAGDPTPTTSPTSTSGKHLLGRLTPEQRACLKEQGITRPIRPLTAEKLQALKAAADACGIDLAPRHHPHLRHKVRAFIKDLSPEQRSCLKENGVKRPFRPVTVEKLQTLRDAAEACDIDLPAWATPRTDG